MKKTSSYTMSKCICQFENGHSRECPLFVEPKNPSEAPQDNWEDEFDKLLSSSIDYYTSQIGGFVPIHYRKKIKSFIHDLLLFQKETILKKIKDYFSDGEYEAILKDLEELLK